jgi:hypothetical protein
MKPLLIMSMTVINLIVIVVISFLMNSCRRQYKPDHSISSCKTGEILRTDGKEFRCVTKKEYRNEEF